MAGSAALPSEGGDVKSAPIIGQKASAATNRLRRRPSRASIRAAPAEQRNAEYASPLRTAACVR